ncbi:MAG: hypothetical protein NC200_00980 [Candidatus Gastranaerophilales bacterium]|nr:hypothetical protein [Candidatus Gastranaerophilales bacterium]
MKMSLPSAALLPAITISELTAFTVKFWLAQTAPPFLSALLLVKLVSVISALTNVAIAPPSTKALLPSNVLPVTVKSGLFVASLRVAIAPPTVFELLLKNLEFLTVVSDALPTKIAPPPPSSAVVNVSFHKVECVLLFLKVAPSILATAPAQTAPPLVPASLPSKVAFRTLSSPVVPLS